MASEQPERYRGERVALLKRIPANSPRVLVAGCGRGEIPYLLKRAGFPEVDAVEPREAMFELAATITDRVYSAIDSVPAGTYNCVVLQDIDPWHSQADEALIQLRTRLASPNGQFVWLVDHAGYVSGAGPAAYAVEAAMEAAQRAGLHPFLFWEDIDERPATDGEETIEEKRRRMRRVLFRMVLPEYSPLHYARELHEKGRSDWAYHTLEEIPKGYLNDPQVVAGIQYERIFYLIHWLGTQPPEQAWFHANAIHDLFYEASGERPADAEGYRCYAELLRRCGELPLAREVLRCFHDVYPDEGVREHLQVLESLPEPVHPPVPPEPDSNFAWPGGARFLFMLHPRPHYGADVLYEGLCAALGDEAVDEWPHKPTLHGAQPEHLRNYPCYFDRGGTELEDEVLADRLRSGYYTAILYGDCEKDLPRERVHRLLDAAGSTPIVLIDALDEFYDARPELEAHLGIPRFEAYFKREMVRFHDYGRDTFPLPFAYAGQLGGNPPWESRNREFLWAGHRMLGMRRIVLDALEQHMGWTLNEFFETEKYNRILEDTRVGLNLFGKGFDTVRYWELPAHGCLLVSRRLPIHVPHDFVDGESAVFFESVNELESKLRYYLEQTDAAAQIASQGYKHWRAHHTAEARARQFLWYLHRRLGQGTA
ncbi:MAG: glycosyltransferase [Candidatus Hydrogenedens sp.]|nr:glycosyltransferase [Candidatus Hydrogenedens sp.]